MDLDLRLIRYALALADRRNFALAAKTLHITQPTLSRSIASLERLLGVQLFDRKASGVEPTTFGRIVLERGARLLGGEEDLRREIQLHAGLEIGSIAVSAGPYPFEVSVGTAVTRLIAMHPQLTVQANVAHARDVVQDVANGRVDVGVTDARVVGSSPGLTVEPLPMHAILLASRPGHPLAGKRHLSRAEVFAYPIASTLVPGEAAAMVAPGSNVAGQIDPMTGDFRPSIQVNSHAIARQIASESDALVPGAAQMFAVDFASGRLVPIDFDAPEMRTHYAILTLRERTLSPVAQAFIAILREVESTITMSEALPGLHAARPAQPKSRSRGKRR